MRKIYYKNIVSQISKQTPLEYYPIEVGKVVSVEQIENNIRYLSQQLSKFGIKSSEQRMDDGLVLVIINQKNEIIQVGYDRLGYVCVELMFLLESLGNTIDKIVKWHLINQA